MSSPDGIRKYEKKRYRHFDQKLINQLEHRIMYKLLRKAHIENGHILNVPCGFGRFTAILNAFNLKILYFDLHPKMVKRCREQFETNGHSFMNGTIRKLPFKNRCFDAIMTIRFFHHYFDDHDRLLMLRELQRVSKKYVIVTYYKTSFLHTIIKKFNNRGNRIIMLKRKQFYKELETAGLKPIMEKSPLPFLHAQRFLLLEKI